MLTDDQINDFTNLGFIRIKAFSREAAQEMESGIWSTLSRLHGIVKDDRSTWTEQYPSGLQPIKKHPVFAPINSPELIEAIDGLMGRDQWQKPDHWGQFLITFPDTSKPWDVPRKNWHTDYEFTAPVDQLFGLIAFVYLADVPEHSGGTGIISGSHRYVRRFVGTQTKQQLSKMKRVRTSLYKSDPWLRDLVSEEDQDDRIERFMNREYDSDGIPLRVVELTGEAGDVVLGHPWLLHAGSPNCGTDPRMMRVQRLQAVGR